MSVPSAAICDTHRTASPSRKSIVAVPSRFFLTLKDLYSEEVHHSPVLLTTSRDGYPSWRAHQSRGETHSMDSVLTRDAQEEITTFYSVRTMHCLREVAFITNSTALLLISSCQNTHLCMCWSHLGTCTVENTPAAQLQLLFCYPAATDRKSVV